MSMFDADHPLTLSRTNFCAGGGVAHTHTSTGGLGWDVRLFFFMS